MFAILLERFRQKYRTVAYPQSEPVLPPRFKGQPHISASACLLANNVECDICQKVCPNKAIGFQDETFCLDTGLCLFCGLCAESCPNKAITFTKEYRLAVSSRENLIIKPSFNKPEEVAPSVIEPIDKKLQAYFKRSFKIREVAAAGCNACEVDCNVLGTIVFDLPRFGVDYIASPRHADAMMVTGPVPQNMLLAMKKCYEAIPTPKVVIAVGVCAISGGLFKNLKEKGHGVSPHFKVDLFIPGCPPNPYTILDGLLRFIGKF